MKAKGFTLLEMMMVVALLSVAMFISIDFTMRMGLSCDTEVQYKEMQFTTQFMLDEITSDLKESNPKKVLLYSYIDKQGRDQLLLCMATARDRGGIFQYMDTVDGNVVVEPIWQAVTVYTVFDGFLCKYTYYDATLANGFENFQGGDVDIDPENGLIFLKDKTITCTTIPGLSTDNLCQTTVLRQVRQLTNKNGNRFPIQLEVTTEQTFREMQGGTATVENFTNVISRNRN